MIDQPRYLSPESAQTLREAIAELRRVEGQDSDAAETVAAELRDDIEVHDVIHALFGCPTDLEGEIIAHVFTVFGTTVAFRDLRRVSGHRDHREALSRIGHWKLLATWARSAPRIVSAIRNARRMKRRFPVADAAVSLDRRLRDLRAEYGIRLVRFGADEQRRSRGGAALRHIHTDARV